MAIYFYHAFISGTEPKPKRAKLLDDSRVLLFKKQGHLFTLLSRSLTPNLFLDIITHVSASFVNDCVQRILVSKRARRDAKLCFWEWWKDTQIFMIKLFIRSFVCVRALLSRLNLRWPLRRGKSSAGENLADFLFSSSSRCSVKCVCERVRGSTYVVVVTRCLWFMPSSFLRNDYDNWAMTNDNNRH